MKKTLGALTVAVAALSSGLACADNYWALGVSSFELESSFDGFGMTADVKAIEGVYGFTSSPNIAWEARLGLGMGEEDIAFSYQGINNISIGATYKVDAYFSGYFRPQIVKENFQVYGLLGYSSVSGETSFDGSSEDTSDDGFSYGVGAGFIFAEKSSINLEWKNLAKVDGGDIAGMTLNYQRKF